MPGRDKAGEVEQIYIFNNFLVLKMTARADGDKKAVNGKGDGKFRRHALRFMWSEG